MTITLCCPNCGDSEHFATEEDIKGSAGVTVSVAEDGTRSYDHDGDTTMYWDTSTTTGFECTACGWTTEEDDPLSFLTAVDSDEEDDE